MFKYVPNILTIIRFILIPFILLYATEDNYVAVIIVLTISGITDILDGFIARKFNFITDFGRLVDPLADKCTQISVLVVLSVKNIIPLWIIIIVLTKELLCIIGATFVLCEKNLLLLVNGFGKLATVIFYLAIISSMMIRQFNLNYNFDLYLYYLGVVLTVFSFIMYVRLYLTHKFIPRSN